MRIWSIVKHAVMTFWYPYVRALNSIWPSIKIQGKRLVIFPDVYKPLENEYACAEYCREGDRMLDLGCGSGLCFPLVEARIGPRGRMAGRSSQRRRRAASVRPVES